MPVRCWRWRRSRSTEHETSVDLERRLALVGAGAALDIVDRLAIGPVTETAQDDATATYAHRLERRDGQIDWTRPARGDPQPDSRPASVAARGGDAAAASASC